MTSSEDACDKKISSCHHDGALVQSSVISGSQNEANRQENEGRSAGSPPKISYLRGDISPNDVMDTEGYSFRDRHAGRTRSAKNEGSNSRGKETSSMIVSESASDTSIDSGNKASNKLIPRARARAAAKPERFRLPIGIESSTANSTKPKRKASVTSERKRGIANASASPTKGGKVAPDQKNARVAGTWTDKEQQQFKVGCIKFGWGNWSAIEHCIPTRTRNQVKSHAQKFQKHHPEEKIRLDREYKQLLRQKASTTNVKLGSKAKKVQYETAATVQIKSKSRERPKPSDEDAQRKPAKAPKRAPPTRTKEAKASFCDAYAANMSTVAASKPEKELTLDLESPRKRSVLRTRPEGLPGAGAPTVAALKPKEPTLELDSPRKRSQALAIRALPNRKGRAAVRQDTLPGAGAWTFTEQEQFKDGCIIYGWGNWSCIESCVPTRTNAQVKSHAQKFQKHHPLEKQEIEMEHKWRSELIQKMALASKAGAQKHPTPTKNNKAVARGTTPTSTGSWSFTEQKQFEDGCILQGWGNWTDVASHIPTRNSSQVRSHAQKYKKYYAEKRAKLESEHKRHYLHARGETFTEKTPVKTENTQVQHILLGIGGISRSKDNLNSQSTLEPKAKNHVLSPPQSPTRKTTADDYGAAEAILALNFARWDNDKNGRETESSDSQDTGPKDVSRATLPKARDVLGKNKNCSIVGVELEKIEDGSITISEIDSEGNLSATSSKTVEGAAKISEDADVRMNSDSVDDGSSVTVEPNDKDELAPKESNFAAQSFVLKEREYPSILQHASNRPNETNSNSQPPPHWLAADTWDECLAKIRQWNNQLSREEQNMEYIKYGGLTGGVKEQLRQKLFILMNNQPPASFTS
eukprot:CAMPEP_0172563264 /NCGR_PEP_ID=MMETSP1067-20121228/100142_1 /TAXON_ID=265564 ORGANISM="Thalassiosira punctigera, Strain Tpunct2005C2" /NCGR_SAMPLE_ID=MMETSP1067 /ASSEMBLY_ACC=CAM_ASM_000444 /LENGTH=866 /DNA_ID=CAMNT_0013353677 /DNA_START=265 /DNA_END=2865 /DNA_ORIENTATION=+